ncbi:AcrR family transcriptional regulator [Bosea sp. BE271]|uniref:TetR/AcrR family transcriptional regulator n=1 Tax=Bosea TaxID=85413 RepID=UPI00285AB3C4|nr:MULTISPECIES: TetR/AcrR family transcriptional regulator [Bosea]MDR6827667.1 AcrR family transcriptional regulator [Bosea robiniae]MDR6894639.1 AcrR family transcriptional regulator [Bosea sp. BE109]MDR7137773.1 AcrR family transcriptional regulator [Bosea sp. BE168]MDR7174472.1 AcrR family transcriptional regulator [Bosea sp. BE271]
MVTSPKKTRSLAKKAGPIGRPSARDALIDCAIELILEGGVEALTFEGLSERSGLSKGGVLYHFPSREELNKAVRQHVRERYREARRDATNSLPEGPSRELKGWAISALHNRSQLDAVSAKIMTSGLWDSADGTAHHVERFNAIKQGVGFERAAIVYLATEGLWFLELAGFSPFSAKERQRLVLLLLSLADGGEIGTKD